MNKLSEDNFLIFAMNHYEAPTCSNMEEFNDEVKRFGYITRAFKLNTVNTQLILNHIIILYNVFGLVATEMLLFRVAKEYWGYLMPFLIYLNRLDSEHLYQMMINTKLNEIIISELRNL
jgi:hypothetical protein